MNDNVKREDVPVFDLRPNGEIPEGYGVVEIELNKDETNRVVQNMCVMAQLVAATHGPAVAAKKLMMGYEATTVALMQFVPEDQVLAIIDHQRARAVEFIKFKKAHDAGLKAAAAESNTTAEVVAEAMRESSESVKH